MNSELLLLVTDVARQARAYADQLAREHGTTRAQWSIIAWLNRRPNVSQNELAALAELAPMTVARLIDRLQEQGLVVRVSDPADRRIWRLQLTPAAAPLLQNVERYRDQIVTTMLAGLPVETQSALVVGLQQVKMNLNLARRGETLEREFTHVSD